MCVSGRCRLTVNQYQRFILLSWYKINMALNNVGYELAMNQILQDLASSYAINLLLLDNARITMIH
jgi:hypothetical protein